jgi:hypothetical protein
VSRSIAGFIAVAMIAALPVVEQLPDRPELPDPLVMLDGRRVANREQWEKERRPELKELFQHYMYGYLPPPMPVIGKIERTDPKALGGNATLREVTLSFGPPGTPPIHLLLVIPNKHSGPAPVFMGMNFAGNHTVLNDPAIRLPTVWMPARQPGVKDNRATDAGRGSQVDVWALEQSVDRGYAVATFYSGDVDPDRPDKREGIQPHIAQLGITHPGPDDWGTIAAWAWGIQRAVDYLVTVPELDKSRIAVFGHSRLGKTALLAAAFDDRIALAIPHQAGCGGTAPSRSLNPKAETVKQINTNFTYWFDGVFKQFNNHPERLPFDQNCLVALCAPRAVLISAATDDQHANPAGQFDVAKAAAPVYRMLGAGGLDAHQMPSAGTLIKSRLGYYLRSGKHSTTPEDWKAFLDYADRVFHHGTTAGTEEGKKP